MLKHFKLLIPSGLIFTSMFVTVPLAADFISYFKDEAGRTNWQYVANFSSGVLIILLSIAAIVLFLSRRQINQANKALQDMNDELEERVKERTATLDESNQKLTETNALLEGEIAEHLKTTQQLKASESYIKSILESMPIMLVGLNKNDEVTQWNHAAVSLTGIKVDDAMGKDLWQAYPTLPLPRERLHEAIEKGEPVHIRNSQRGQLHFEITIYPLENFIQTGVVILVDDVTQQVQSENKLIEKDKLSAIGEMSSIMAHDINAPLTRIRKQVSLIESEIRSHQGEDEVDLPLFQAVGELKQQSQRASAIVQNLLEFSNASSDGFQPHDILEIINHSIDLCQDIFSPAEGLRFTDIEIERLFEDNLPHIPSYQAELQQVFISLFRYSLYAMQQVSKDGYQPKMTIQVLTSYDNLWVKVSHNGLGIDLDEQQVIFEPFFSDEVIDKDKRRDPSQRLSFPYFIVTQHHKGHMAITSKVDIGTTFHLELPLK